MGVYIDSYSCDFRMKKENIAAALAAAKELVQSGGYAKHWDDRSRQQLLDAPTIDQFLYHVNYWVTEIEDFNIVNLYGENEQYYRTEDFEFFKAIAPYVEEGSTIDIETSDFQKFRWYFDGNTCIRKDGELDYDCSIEIVEAILRDKKMLPMMIGIHPELDKRIAEVLKK